MKKFNQSQQVDVSQGNHNIEWEKWWKAKVAHVKLVDCKTSKIIKLF